MDFKAYAACRTSEGWLPVEIASESQPGIRHVVLVCPWGNAVENICECPGYFHRGRCRHQAEAMDAVCGWTEQQVGQHAQTDEQRKQKICPRCGGPTTWKMEVIDDE